MSCAAIVEVPTLCFYETLPSLLIVVVAGSGLIIHECTPFCQAILA
jgi:hypothetical protein